MTEAKAITKSARAAGVVIFKHAFSVGACAMLLAYGAHAGDMTAEPGEEATGTKIGEFVLNTNAAIVSDYVSRGFTQSSGDPAIQGEFKITRGPFYVGTWASSMNLHCGDCVTSATLHSEFDIYAGVEKELHGFDFELQGMYVTYPGFDVEAHPAFDYWEFKFGVSRQVIERLKLGVALYYSPNYSEGVGTNWIYEGNAELKLPQLAIFSPSITGEIAYQNGNNNRGGMDYWYWDAGLVLSFAKHYKLDFRYYDTAKVSDAICDGECGARFVAGVKAEF